MIRLRSVDSCSRSPGNGSRGRSSRVRVFARGLLLVSLMFGAGACEVCGFRFGEPCDILLDYLCQREDEAYCAKASEFLESRLVDDDNKPLEGEARTQMCAAIDATPELRNAYRFKAEQRVKGTPHIDLSKRARDARLAKRKGEPVDFDPDAKTIDTKDAKAGDE